MNITIRNSHNFSIVKCLLEHRMLPVVLHCMNVVVVVVVVLLLLLFVYICYLCVATITIAITIIITPRKKIEMQSPT